MARHFKWKADSTRARVYVVLEGAAEPLTLKGIREQLNPGVEQQLVSDALYHMKTMMPPLVQRNPVDSTWRLIEGAPRPPIVASTGQPAEARSVTELNLGELGSKADALICKHPHGIDSMTLSQALGVPAEAVDQALAPAVEHHRFITCTVMREGHKGLLYRVSAGATLPFDWMTQSGVTWSARLSQRAREAAKAAALARPVQPAAPAKSAVQVHPDPAPVPAAKPAPAPAPVPVPPAPPVADEVLDAPPPPQPAPQVRLLGEVDIDQLHRDQAAAAGQDEPGRFSCALWSTGVLVLRQHGQQMLLPVEHTRVLFRYLDNLRGGQLASDELEVV